MKKLNNRWSAVYQLTATLAAIMLGFFLGIFATATATEPESTDYKTIAIFLKDIIVFEIENNENESLEETYFDGLANMDCYKEYNSISPKDINDLPKGILTK